MKTDVLFWFYKDFAVCRERIKSLRTLNDDVSVFALYGGPLAEAKAAENAVHDLVDDFYAYPHEKDTYWKWKHGDQLISSWYSERGQYLEWDTVFVMQWDMLILDPLEKLFSGLKPHEILLSGFRPIDTVSSWWNWADPKNSDILSFKALLKERYDYEGELFACLFIVVCLPRSFLRQYVACGCGEIGFLEYKLPTMAQVFGTPVCHDHEFTPWWLADPATKNAGWREKTLNAVGHEVPRWVILSELADRDGKRLFHPVSKTLPGWMNRRHVAKPLSYLYLAIEVPHQYARKAGHLLKNLTLGRSK